MNFRLAFFATLAVVAATAAHAQGTLPVVDTTPKLAFGQMMKSGDKLVFAPCRDRSYATFEDISNGQQVTKALNLVGLDTGKKLYVEVIGILENSLLKASEINMARAEGRCQLPGGQEEVWRAAGNEPGWALVASPANEMVMLKRQGKPDVSVPYAAFKTEAGVAQFEASKDNQKLAVRFEHKQCRDTMADAVYGWTATVSLNGQVLKGCAWQR
jgi:putative lipoprotein